ncbi:hypothetical protein AJ79_09540 [Helicocarpus griseus UAMH5409]|uniref:Rhodopsin domain-containing protein n=1 Tax=Helicocarpus griseus UAMH5409 TaxID=1447875 RepID=A0A2B7WJ68_9EURO|nr:hypothetical protein AJ79_09540 [Helicocarpus griseus UAMH5409]
MSSIGKSTPGHPSRGWDLWIVSTVMVIVAGLFVSARLIGRHMSGGFQGFKIDDYTILAALANSIVLSVTENMAVVHGYGRHAWDLSAEEKIMALKYFYAAQIFYKIVIALAKMSILFLYRRIFYIERYFCWACNFLNVFTAAHGLAFILATVWQCDPVAAFWDKDIPGSYCIDSHAFWLAYSVINIVTDVVMLILPVQEVLRLKLRRRDKCALVFVFTLGAFVCITSIIRATTLASSSDSTDSTWAPIPATVWSVVECNTGIICACLPLIRQPLSIIFPYLASDTTRNRSTARSFSLPHSLYLHRMSRDPTNSNSRSSTWMGLPNSAPKSEPLPAMPDSATRERFPRQNSEEEIMARIDMLQGQSLLDTQRAEGSVHR